jgi:Protein of unknown function (DUF4230)
MSKDPQYVLLTPANGQAGARRPDPVWDGIKVLLMLGVIMFLGFSGYLTWRWADRNLLHWGIQGGQTTRVNTADLVERLHVFEVVSVKDRYRASSQIDVDKVFAAGPARVGLPGWVAGQRLDVSGDVVVAAGVDLGSLRASDIDVQRQGREMHVIIAVPQPEILSTELVPNSFDVDTSQGVLTRIKTRLGFSETDLRDKAVDQLTQSAQKAAVNKGLLDEAATETQRRLVTFLQGLPQSGGDRITYEIQVKPRV